MLRRTCISSTYIVFKMKFTDKVYTMYIFQGVLGDIGPIVTGLRGVRGPPGKSGLPGLYGDQEKISDLDVVLRNMKRKIVGGGVFLTPHLQFKFSLV